MLKSNKVDGLIAITYSDIDKYVSSNLPFVSVDRHFSEKIPYVTSANYEGGNLAAKELLRRGASHLAYIGGRNIFANETSYRKDGFLAQCQLATDKKVSVLEMPEPIEDFEGQLRTFIQKYPDIDGIFVINDFMGLSIIHELEKIGKQTPRDYQIIGFDGLRASQSQDFYLSTIAQSLPEMAEAAVSLLFDVMSGAAEEERVLVPVRFVEGGSTRLLEE